MNRIAAAVLWIVALALGISAAVERVNHNRVQDFQNSWGRLNTSDSSHSFSTLAWQITIDNRQAPPLIIRKSIHEPNAAPQDWGVMPSGDSHTDPVMAHGRIWVFAYNNQEWQLFQASTNEPNLRWNTMGTFAKPILHFSLDRDGSPYWIASPSDSARYELVQGEFLGGGSTIRWNSARQLPSSEVLAYIQSHQPLGGQVSGEFDMEDSARFLALAWEAQGLRASSIRYRVSPSDKDPYGAWSEPVSDLAFQLNKTGRFFQYQIAVNPEPASPMKSPRLLLSYYRESKQNKKRGGIIALLGNRSGGLGGRDLFGLRPDRIKDDVSTLTLVPETQDKQEENSSELPNAAAEASEPNVSESDPPAPVNPSDNTATPNQASSSSDKEPKSNDSNPLSQESEKPSSNPVEPSDSNSTQKSEPHAAAPDRNSNSLKKQQNKPDEKSEEKSQTASPKSASQKNAQSSDPNTPSGNTPNPNAPNSSSPQSEKANSKPAESDPSHGSNPQRPTSNRHPQSSQQENQVGKPERPESESSQAKQDSPEPKPDSKPQEPSQVKPIASASVEPKENGEQESPTNADPGHSMSGAPENADNPSENDTAGMGGAQSGNQDSGGSPQPMGEGSPQVLGEPAGGGMNADQADQPRDDGKGRITGGNGGGSSSDNTSPSWVEEATSSWISSSNQGMTIQQKPRDWSGYLPWLLLALFGVLAWILFRLTRIHQEEERVPISVESLLDKGAVQESLEEKMHSRFSAVVEQVDYNVSGWEGVIHCRPDIIAAAVQDKQAVWLKADKTLVQGPVQLFLHALELEQEILAGHDVFKQYRLERDVKRPRLALAGKQVWVLDQDVRKRGYVQRFTLEGDNRVLHSKGPFHLQELSSVNRLWMAHGRVWVRGIRDNQTRILPGMLYGNEIRWKEDYPKELQNGRIVTASQGKDLVMAGFPSDDGMLKLYRKKSNEPGWQTIAKTPFASSEGFLYSDAKRCFLVETPNNGENLVIHVLTRQENGVCAGRLTRTVPLPINTQVEQIEISGGRLFVIGRDITPGAGNRLVLMAGRVAELLGVEAHAAV